MLQNVQNSKAVEIQFKLIVSIFPAGTKFKIKRIMKKSLILIFLFLLTIYGQQQNYNQISECLGNCIYCNSTEPQVCLDSTLKKSSNTICVPFYKGVNCTQQTFAYENIIRQTKTFDGWDSIKVSQCLLVSTDKNNNLISNQNVSFVGLGSMSSNQNLSRIISLNNSMSTNRLIVKFSVAVDDSSIQNYFANQNSINNNNGSTSTSSNQTIIEQVQINGVKVIKTTVIIDATSNSSSVQYQSAASRKLMYFQLIDTVNTSKVIERKLLNYNTLSKIRTSCGYIYTYQLSFDLFTQYSQLTIKLYLANPQTDQKDVAWTILNFQANVGCRGYVVSSSAIGSYNCDTCLSGFYPIYSVINQQVQQCKICDYRCKTCVSLTSCLTCIENTIYNQNTRMCQFSQYFQALQNYTLKSGKTIPSAPGQFFQSNIISTSNGNLQFVQPLNNFQPYTVTFDILYSQFFRNSGQIVKVIINGEEFNFNSNTLSLTVPTIISGISSSTNMIYRQKLNFSTNGITQANYNASLGNLATNGSSTNNNTTNTNNTNTTNTNNTSTNGSSTTNGSLTTNTNSSSQATTFQSNMKILCTGIADSALTGNSGQEVGITNLNLIQFQCTKNCLQCTYSSKTETSECKKCSNFFQLDSNCLNCANGYYKLIYLDNSTTTTTTDTTINTTTNTTSTASFEEMCVKCHSTCKQCLGKQIQDCLFCYDGYQLGNIIYDYKCIDCLYNYQYQQNNLNVSGSQIIASCNAASYCLNQHPLTKVLTNQQCQQCLSGPFDQLTISTVCRNCWLQQNLAHSNCQPVPQRGYKHYGSDISQGVISNQWKSNKPLIQKSLNNQYTNLYGVDNENVSVNQTTYLAFTEQFLPVHRGLNIFFNIFKINTWNKDSYTQNAKINDTINIVIKSQNTIIRNQTINVANSIGSNIWDDFNSGNQMIYTFFGNYQQHTITGKLEINITTTHTGVFVKDVQVYLGNCPDCDGNKMNYQIYYIPMYSSNQTKTGLDVWLTFNQGVNFASKDQTTQQLILKSFQFSIDTLGYDNLLPFIIRQNKINKWNYVKYFIPIDQSILNGTLRVNNSLSFNIYSKVSKVQAYQTNPIVKHNRNLIEEEYENLIQIQQQQKQKQTKANKTSLHTRILLNERLESVNQEERVHRYENLKLDQRKSMEQLDQFYNFFQWFGLYSIIVFAFFGLGLVFEEFSILLQLLFLHIYISTNLLPATFKQPLSHMEKMENLNFFAYPHAQSIEDGLFKNIEQKTPYPLAQYNIDVYFARSFYPIIIINLIYLFWFLVLLICLKVIKKFRQSQNRVVKFFRDIPQRPVNYFDQIWRYQFITTMWACFIQFYQFCGQTGEMRLNLALCIISFIVSLIWPVFVMAYTYNEHKHTNIEDFAYLYGDIYYQKISSVADQTKFYLYTAVRFGRYFFYTLFIAVFIFQYIIGPAILLAVTVLEVVYILNFSIYRDNVLLTFKLIQSLGWIIIEILMLVIYGFSNDTISEDGFISFGYGIGTLFILMIINGIARFLYIGYKKIKKIVTETYDYGERGELENYDHKNPIPIELPPTQRGLI